MNRSFLRRLKKRKAADSKLMLRSEYKQQITNKFYECLNECVKDEELKKDPKKLWQLVNFQWNEWIKEQLNSKEIDKKIFRSVLESATMIINRDFQARQEKLKEEEGL